MSKQFWGVIVVVILLIAGVFVLTGNNSSDSKNTVKAGTTTNHVEGQGKAGVTLVEYGDYECPFCGQFYPIVKQVQSEFNDQIIFQFRNFPLVSLHRNAFAGARAAEAAAMQNKFWEMHDLLYQNQNQWSSSNDPTTIFNQYATALGLNLTKFKQDFASGTVNNLINGDTAAGNKLKIQGTPTFFLDGKLIQVGQANSAQPVFENLIKTEIAKKAGQTSTSAPTTTSPTGQTTAPAKQ
ncbi:MAG TPA: thioredoxin domain-containing protein [Candidatus Saccharimonadales bacterium]|nr:thioredoxin domain-containing protein [Candidatus Saccharimonadales bacterium]